MQFIRTITVANVVSPGAMDVVNVNENIALVTSCYNLLYMTFDQTRVKSKVMYKNL